VVLVLSADHVYRLDYGEVLARHRERGAAVTVVTSEVSDEAEASRQAVVEVAGDGRLTGPHGPARPERPVDLDDPAWPVLGRAPHRPPARVEGSARLEGALLSPGSAVGGEVTRSVLGPGVVVEPGACVRDAVLLDDCVVAAGAQVERAVLDRGVRVGPDARVGDAGDDGDPAQVGEGAQLPGGTRVAPGGRFSQDGRRRAVGRRAVGV